MDVYFYNKWDGLKLDIYIYQAEEECETGYLTSIRQGAVQSWTFTPIRLVKALRLGIYLL